MTSALTSMCSELFVSISIADLLHIFCIGYMLFPAPRDVRTPWSLLDSDLEVTACLSSFLLCTGQTWGKSRVKQGPGGGCLAASSQRGHQGGKWFRGEVEKEEGVGTLRWQIDTRGHIRVLFRLTWASAPVSEVGEVVMFPDTL